MVAVRVPEVPVIVSAYCPGETLLDKVSVSVYPMADGVKAAVTPLGRPLMEKLMLPLKPVVEFTSMRMLEVVPCPRKTLFRLGLIVKLGAAITRVTEVVDVWPPEVPTMVKGYCPKAVVFATVRVNWLWLATGFCEKEAVTPLGRPETDTLTFPVNPYSSVMESAPLQVMPCPNETVDADTFTVKVGT